MTGVFNCREGKVDAKHCSTNRLIIPERCEGKLPKLQSAIEFPGPAMRDINHGSRTIRAGGSHIRQHILHHLGENVANLWSPSGGQGLRRSPARGKDGSIPYG